MMKGKMTYEKKFAASVLAAALALAGTQARAEDGHVVASDASAQPALADIEGPIPDGDDSDGWQFSFIPYVWATGIDGDLTHPQLPVNVRVRASFGDVLENLDIGGMATLEARKGRFGVLVDAIYSRSSGEASLTSLPTVPVVLPIGVPVEARAENTSLLGALQYRVGEKDSSTLDMLVGARYWSVETNLSYAIPAPIPLPPQFPIPRQYDLGVKRDWVDATVGVKGQFGIAPRLSGNAWLIYGTGGSDGTLDVMVSLQYRLSRAASLFAGYRRIEIEDTGSSGFRYDVALHGPGIGLGLHF